MSLYGEDGDTGYAKEDLYDEMYEFLENHTIYELLEILADVVRTMEKS